MDPAKLELHRDSDFIPVGAFSSIQAAMKVLHTPNIGTNMEIGVDVNSNAGIIVGNAGITAERILITNNPIAHRPAGSSSLFLEPVGSSDILAIVFESTDFGPRHHMLIPRKWDRRYPIYVRAIWEHQLSSIGTQEVQWRFVYEAITSGAVNILSTAPASVLDTVIPAETPALPQANWKQGSLGTMNAKSLLNSAVPHPFMLHFALGVVALDNWSGSFPRLLGIEIEFTPRWGFSERQTEARAYEA